MYYLMTIKQQIGKWLIPRLPVTRLLFDQLRLELNATCVEFRNRFGIKRRRRLRMLRNAKGVYANVACGPHILENFVNLDLFATHPDVIAWDCRRTLPFGNATVVGIRVEHFVEHLETREELPAFLQKCHRVLIPGGVLRIIVPDAERFLHAYCSGDMRRFHELAVPDPLPEDLPTPMDVVNHVFHQWHEHRWGYDFETLAHRLRTAGFEQIEQKAFGSSVDPLLAADREHHAPYSLYVDAVKTGPM